MVGGAARARALSLEPPFLDPDRRIPLRADNALLVVPTPGNPQVQLWQCCLAFLREGMRVFLDSNPVYGEGSHRHFDGECTGLSRGKSTLPLEMALWSGHLVSWWERGKGAWGWTI